MVIENIAKPLAESYKALLSEFRPDWDVEIRIGDYNLYKLGFVNEIPCSLCLTVSDEQLQELQDALYELEADAYSCEEYLAKRPVRMTEEEKTIRKTAREHQARYRKYAPLEAVCNYWMYQRS
ncbi:MAG: hypothetical protein PT965_06885 [Clostridia bacterium]|nr:hypothetical protein [Clostridia bacterium]MDY2930461.1 hypothetical protein [Clostridiaceae bacterium]